MSSSCSHDVYKVHFLHSNAHEVTMIILFWMIDESLHFFSDERRCFALREESEFL